MKRVYVAIIAGIGVVVLAVVLMTAGGSLPVPFAGDDRYVADGCTPSSVDPYGNFEEARFPLRSDLPGGGERVLVVGHVLDAECRGVAGATVKFWAAIETGEYTDDSYGSVVTDKDGGFQFSTHYPGTYPDRQAEPHVHVMTEILGIVVFDEILPGVDGVNAQLQLVGGGTPPPSTTIPPNTIAPGPNPFLP